MTPRVERPFEDGRLAFEISSDAPRFPFVEFAEALVDERDGVITRRLGALGMDEVYWDIRLGDHVLTLHSQHFAGVYLCASDEASEAVLRDLVPFVEGFVRGLQGRPSRGRLRAVWRKVRGVLAMVRDEER